MTDNKQGGKMIHRTRISVPTQLREAGHTVTARVGEDGRLVYAVDGEDMRLDEAADRYLPGGWSGSFGRGDVA